LENYPPRYELRTRKIVLGKKNKKIITRFAIDLRIKDNVCKIMSNKYILRQREVAVHLNLLMSPSKNSDARQVETLTASEEDEYLSIT